MQQCLTPLSSYRSPKYPTKEDVRKNPRLLFVTPRRWNGKPAVMTALLLTISTGLAGCSSRTDTSAAGLSSVENSENAAQSIVENSETLDGSSVENQNILDAKIPIFEHGTGRGSYGCVSVAPPVFLSEEEALQVIQEEAAAQGVHFTAQKTIEGEFPATDLFDFQDASDKTATWQGELLLDGYDEALKIGVEFVSQQDVIDWHSSNSGMYASVEEYEMLDTAKRLSQAAPGVAVFYDPTSQDYDAFDTAQLETFSTNEDFANYEESYIAKEKEKSVEDLRAQVRDFLQWLAAQGVI